MKNRYIVTTHKDVDQNEFIKLLKKHQIDININYDGLKRTYYISMMANKVPLLLAEPEVLHVAPAEAPVKLMNSQTVKVDRYGYGGNWGLIRICKRNDWNDGTWYPITGQYNYFRTGKNVDVYVVDTGINPKHTDFENRVTVIFDYFRHHTDPNYGHDEQGHGTHVASTIAGKKHGVAKEAHIYVSRVFETGGTTLSAIVSGIDACLRHHRQKKADGSNNPSVMNLSLGGPPHITEEQAINDCIEEGIVVVAAAGNDGQNLAAPGYDVMPAEIERAITVGAVDIQDKIAGFSNYGAIVDVFAPGVYITAANYLDSTGELMLSGTSMAAPHVVGVCALKLENFGITKNSDDVRQIHDWIRNNATVDTLMLTEGVIDAGTANRFLFSEFVTEEIIEPEPEPEPTPEPEPEPEPTPEPEPEPPVKGKKKGWWKKDRKWNRGTSKHQRTIDRHVKKINDMYEKFFSNRNDIVEDYLAQLELAAEKLANSGKFDRVDCYYTYRAILDETVKILRIQRRA